MPVDPLASQPTPAAPQPTPVSAQPTHVVELPVENTFSTPPVAPVHTPTDVLGLVSIIIFFVGLAPVGLVLGIMGISAAKKKGLPTTLSKIGVILNGFILILAVLAIALVLIITTGAGHNKAAQNARDAERKADILTVKAALEVYAGAKNSYPTLAQLNSEGWRSANKLQLKGETLADPSHPSVSILSASAVSGQYAYIPTNADGSVCTIDAGCPSYSLIITFEDPNPKTGKSTYTTKSLLEPTFKPL